ILSAVFSADGRRVTVVGRDRTLRVWDIATSYQPVIATLEHEDYVNQVAFSPDGRRVVTASSDHTARIWDAMTGKQIGDALQHGGENVHEAFFNTGGDRVLTVAEKTARVWNAMTGKPMSQPLRSKECLAFDPDGQNLVAFGREKEGAAGKDKLHVW